MNKLEIKEISLSKEYANECFFIDDIPLHEHLKHLNKKINLEELTIAWLAPYDNDGDARFMKWLLKKDKLNLPILLCPEDLDFSCTVIIAEIKKTDKYVIWKRIGQINHSIENLEQEKKHGIFFADNYSDEYWKKNKDIESMNIESKQWHEWTSTHWSEELFRRRTNYTYQCYQNDKNINWLYNCNWCFNKKEYEELIDSCKIHQKKRT